jgi:GTP-binding protein HflX
VFNKADKIGLATLPTNENKMFISAKNHLNLNLLEQEIKKALFSDWIHCKMFIPYENGSILSYLNEKASVIDVKYLEEGSMVDVELSPIDFNKYIDYIWVDNKN